MRSVDEAHHLACGDSRAQDARGVAMHLQRHRLGVGKQCQLGGGLHHPAAVDRGRAVEQPDAACLGPQPLGPLKGKQRIDAQLRNPGGRERIGEQRDRVLVLLPQPDVRVDREIGLQRAEFERRAQQHRAAACRQQHRHQPLARAPGHAREIAQRRPDVQKQPVRTARIRERAGTLEPRLPLCRTDGIGAIRPRGDGREFGLCARSADGHACSSLFKIVRGRRAPGRPAAARLRPGPRRVRP